MDRPAIASSSSGPLDINPLALRRNAQVNANMDYVDRLLNPADKRRVTHAHIAEAVSLRWAGPPITDPHDPLLDACFGAILHHRVNTKHKIMENASRGLQLMCEHGSALAVESAWRVHADAWLASRGSVEDKTMGCLRMVQTASVIRLITPRNADMIIGSLQRIAKRKLLSEPGNLHMHVAMVHALGGPGSDAVLAACVKASLEGIPGLERAMAWIDGAADPTSPTAHAVTAMDNGRTDEAISHLHGHVDTGPGDHARQRLMYHVTADLLSQGYQVPQERALVAIGRAARLAHPRVSLSAPLDLVVRQAFHAGGQLREAAIACCEAWKGTKGLRHIIGRPYDTIGATEMNVMALQAGWCSEQDVGAVAEYVAEAARMRFNADSEVAREAIIANAPNGEPWALKAARRLVADTADMKRDCPFLHENPRLLDCILTSERALARYDA